MSDPINIRGLPPGTRIVTGDGAVAEIVSNPADGVWLFARYLEAPRDPSLVGQEDMIFAQDVVAVRDRPKSQEMPMTQPAPSPYAGDAAYWNSMAGRAWVEHHERQDFALAPLSAAALRLAMPQTGEHVLDIGCGSGTTVLDLAARVGPTGRVLGVDIAEASVARANQRITAAGLTQAEIVCADAATQPFEAGSFDLVFSRLGVMFFADPTSAFANVHRAVRPAGRLLLAVFRAADENPWPQAPLDAVRHLLPPTAPPRPGDPGMFSWGDPARVRMILQGAGFRETALTPVDLDYRIAGAGGAAEAAEFAMLFGPLTRLIGQLSEERRQEVRATLENFFTDHATPEGVSLPAAFWVVQARA